MRVAALVKSIGILLLACLALSGCAMPLSFEIVHLPGEEVFLPARSEGATPLPKALPTPTPTPAPERDLSRSVYASYLALAEEDFELAAKVAYLEARGRGEEAYRAVLSVLYNRCMAPRFGGGMTSVETEVYRSGQFSVVNHKGFATLEPPEEIVAYAQDVFAEGNTSLPHNVLFFCAMRLGKDLRGGYYKGIGGNLFYYGSVERR